MSKPKKAKTTEKKNVTPGATKASEALRKKESIGGYAEEEHKEKMILKEEVKKLKEEVKNLKGELKKTKAHKTKNKKNNL